MPSLWPTQKQGDRSYKKQLPNTLLEMLEGMAGPRAKNRVLLSNLARAAAKKTIEQPVCYWQY